MFGTLIGWEHIKYKKNDEDCHQIDRSQTMINKQSDICVQIKMIRTLEDPQKMKFC